MDLWAGASLVLQGVEHVQAGCSAGWGDCCKHGGEGGDQQEMTDELMAAVRRLVKR